MDFLPSIGPLMIFFSLMVFLRIVILIYRFRDFTHTLDLVKKAFLRFCVFALKELFKSIKKKFLKFEKFFQEIMYFLHLTFNFY